jgi:hypothetical protein
MAATSSNSHIGKTARGTNRQAIAPAGRLLRAPTDFPRANTFHSCWARSSLGLIGGNGRGNRRCLRSSPSILPARQANDERPHQRLELAAVFTPSTGLENISWRGALAGLDRAKLRKSWVRGHRRAHPQSRPIRPAIVRLGCRHGQARDTDHRYSPGDESLKITYLAGTVPGGRRDAAARTAPCKSCGCAADTSRCDVSLWAAADDRVPCYRQFDAGGGVPRHTPSGLCSVTRSVVLTGPVRRRLYRLAHGTADRRRRTDLEAARPACR